MAKLSVLVIEDTRAIAAEVCDYLESQNIQTDYAATGKQGVRLAEDHRYDVIVLDLMLPDIDGVKVCELIKQQSERVPPILMLTARDSMADKTKGFEAGADDYLTKPFALTELLLRVKALARRQQLHLPQTMVVGELELNEKQKTAIRAGQELKLSATDFEILLVLSKAFPSAVSRQELVERIWGDDLPDSDVVRSHMYTLRRAVDKPFSYPMIATLHGIGFKLQVLD